jgi:hypothetical protein
MYVDFKVRGILASLIAKYGPLGFTFIKMLPPNS